MEIDIVVFSRNIKEIINGYVVKNTPYRAYYGMSYNLFCDIYRDLFFKEQKTSQVRVGIFDYSFDKFGYFGNLNNAKSMTLNEYEILWNTKYPIATCARDGCDNKFRKFQSSHIYCSKECGQMCSESSHDRGRFVIFERDNFKCFYCGKSSYVDKKELHCDHVFPKSLGGRDIAGNLVTSCFDCNLEKHTLIINNMRDLLKEIRKRNKSRNIPNNLRIKL